MGEIPSANRRLDFPACLRLYLRLAPILFGLKDYLAVAESERYRSVALFEVIIEPDSGKALARL
ncbi:MAG: hypothetical protein ABIH46_05445 [Chloroflexota bacterium]